jgi:putative hydrolase of the HAD superfamily
MAPNPWPRRREAQTVRFSVFFGGRAVHKQGMEKRAKTAPEAADFAHVRDWVFDLDNTLYPHHINLFSQIDVNMTAFVQELLQLERDEARALQKKYYHEHGTTLQGLMLNHGIDPDAFLEKAHAIDYSALLPHPELGDAIKALPGRKFIFTNGSVPHAEAAARALGILDHFDDIFDIVAAGYLPKPAGETYDKFASLHRVDTAKAAMFEDLPRNLKVPKALGMRTVLLVPRNLDEVLIERWEKLSDEDDHIDYVADDLTGFLQALRTA